MAYVFGLSFQLIAASLLHQLQQGGPLGIFPEITSFLYDYFLPNLYNLLNNNNEPPLFIVLCFLYTPMSRLMTIPFANNILMTRSCLPGD